MKSIYKTSIRAFKTSRARFFSILSIVAIGIGFFAGVKAACPDMKLTAETYYARQNLMDMRLLSTYGFDQDDLAALQAMDGVQVYASDFVDCSVGTKTDDLVGRVYALPAVGPDVNRLTLLEGRYPQAENECLYLSSPLKHAFPLDETVSFHNDTGDLENMLSNTSYKIVGKAYSPLYISYSEFGNTNVGAGKLEAVFYIPECNFHKDVRTQAYLTFDDLHGLESFEQDYEAALAQNRKKVELLANARSQARYERIRGDAQREIDDAQREIDRKEAALAQAENELEEAARKLGTAARKLQASKIDLDAARAELTRGETAYQTQIKQAQAALEQQQAEWASGSDAYRQGIHLLETGKAEYEGGAASLNLLLQQIEQLEAQYGADAPAVLALRAQYAEGEQKLAKLLEQLTHSEQALETTKQQLDDAAALLKDAAAAIEAEKKSGKEKLDAAADALASGSAQYQSGQAAYEKNLADYNAAKAAFEAEKPDALSKLSQAREQVQEARTALADLEPPVWHFYDRSDNPAHTEYWDNADRIDNIAKVFPAFFILVAALVCMTTMTRMVDEERAQIGTLKALGYGNLYILQKYMFYALSATVTGAVFGLLVGFQLFPQVIMNAYGILYSIPDYQTPFRWGVAIGCFVTAVAVVSLTVYAACKNALHHKPAKLLRPKAPKSGKRIFLERMPFLWNHLNFSKKVSARNILRYKKRMLMTVIGIMGGTALTLTGFGLRDSITNIAHHQFDRIWLYQATLATNDHVSLTAWDALKQTAQSHVPDAMLMQAMQKTQTASRGGEKADVNCFIPADQSALPQFIHLGPRSSETTYDLDDDGVLITEKLSMLLGVSIGDTIHLELAGTNGIDAVVSGICENYVYHYVYISPALYTSWTGKAPDYNTALLKYDADLTAQQRSELSQALMRSEAVLGLQMQDDIAVNFDHMMRSLDLIVVVLIISAGVLAFVVLYNLNNININERIREIATLKVLGFYDKEVSMYVFRETIVITLLGITLGLIGGRFLTFFVIQTAELEMFMFGREIFAPSYLWAALMTVVFSLIVAVFTHLHLKRIPMVESLKAVD